MSIKKRPLDKEYLHEIFSYRDDGFLVWKPRPLSLFGIERIGLSWNAKHAGKVAGHEADTKYGRFSVTSVEGRTITIHRAVWVMHNGPVPEGMLMDHINGNPFDNRIQNLRMVTSAQNCMNRRHTSVNSTGLKGVHEPTRNPGYFVAQIRIGRKTLWLGQYNSKGMAAVAYAKASIRYHGQFSPFMRRLIALN